LSFDGDRARSRNYGAISQAVTPALALALKLDDAFLNEIPEPVAQRPIGYMDDCPDLCWRGPVIALVTEEGGHIRFIGHISANLPEFNLYRPYIGHRQPDIGYRDAKSALGFASRTLHLWDESNWLAWIAVRTAIECRRNEDEKANHPHYHRF